MQKVKRLDQNTSVSDLGDLCLLLAKHTSCSFSG